jgi:anti-anti-sigma factor
MPLSPDCPLLEETPEGMARLNLRSLDELEAERARPRLFGLAQSRPGRDLRLDLGGLEYLSSTGLGLLVALDRHVRAAGGHLSLHNVAAPVYEVFSVTRLTTLLDVRQDAASGAPAEAA